MESGLEDIVMQQVKFHEGVLVEEEKEVMEVY